VPNSQFHTLADAIPHLCWIASGDGWIYWYNQRWFDYTGTNAQQMEGWGWQSVHDPATLPLVMERWQASIATGTPFEMVFPLRGADGVFRPFLTRVVPVHDKQGKLERWFGTNTDIGEQRRTEQALRESEERLSLAQQVARVGTFDWDIPTGVNRWTRELEAMYGLEPGHFASTTPAWYQLVHPDDRASVIETSRAAMENGGFESEWRVIWPEGSVRWLQGRGWVFKDEAGQPVRMIGVNIDITDRKNAEHALRESEMRYQTLTEALPAIVFTTSSDAQVDYINCRWKEYTGLELEPHAAEDLDAAIHPDDRQHVENRRSTAKADGLAYEVEYRLKRADGVYRWFYLKAVPLHDNRGAVVKWLSISSDIDDEKNAAARLRQSQKMEAIGRLAGGVAHDFNNLLTAIVGFNGMLVDALANQPELLAFAREVQGAAARATSLTHQLLTFSRRDILKPKVLALNDVVLGMRTLLGRVIGEDIEIVTVLPPNIAQVRIDPVQLDQVIMNLAVNARDAMPEGGRLTLKTANVTVSPELAQLHTAMPGPYVMLQVSDNGCGMSADTEARMFEPFFTTKEEGKGTGLGLATVYGVVQGNRGFLAVESEPDAGATFKIYLPVSDRPASNDIAPPRPASTPYAIADQTILLVEDDPTVRKFAAVLLAHQGYRTLIAATPVEAIELVRRTEEPILALVTDVLMPEMRGPELAKQIQALRPGLPVIYMSGYSDRTYLSPDVRQGAFLQKPFTSDELAEALQKVLGEPLPK